MGHGGRDFLPHRLRAVFLSLKGSGTCRRFSLFAGDLVAECGNIALKEEPFRGHRGDSSTSTFNVPLDAIKFIKAAEPVLLTNTRGRGHVGNVSHVSGIRFSFPRETERFHPLNLLHPRSLPRYVLPRHGDK